MNWLNGNTVYPMQRKQYYACQLIIDLNVYDLQIEPGASAFYMYV